MTPNIEDTLILAWMQDRITDEDLELGLTGHLTPAAADCIRQDYMSGYLVHEEIQGIVPMLVLADLDTSTCQVQ